MPSRGTFRNPFRVKAFYKARSHHPAEAMRCRGALVGLVLLLALAGLAPSLRASMAASDTARALAALDRVLVGLEQLRGYLATTNASSSALAALDRLIENLRATAQLVAGTGDVRAAELTLSYTSAELGRLLAPSPPQAPGADVLARALQVAQQRAAQLWAAVNQLPEGPLRLQLRQALSQANGSLSEASALLSKGDVKDAARALSRAKALLGAVNAALARQLQEERLAKYGPELRQRLQGALGHLLERLAKLKGLGLTGSSLVLLLRAEASAANASRLLGSSDLKGALASLAEAEQLLDEVEEHAGEARQALLSLMEAAKALSQRLNDLSARLSSLRLPQDVLSRALPLLANASSLVNRAVELAAQGRLDDASALLLQASQLEAQLGALLEHAAQAEAGAAKLEVRALLIAERLSLEIANAGKEPAIIAYIYLIDGAGRNVSLSWSSSCITTLAPGERVGCSASLQAMPGANYTLVIGAKPLSSPALSEMRLPLGAPALPPPRLGLEGEIEHGVLKIKLKAEGAGFTLLSIRVLDARGAEVSLGWTSPCPQALGAGQAAECEATGTFEAGKPYLLIVRASAQGGPPFELQLTLLAEEEH